MTSTTKMLSKTEKALAKRSCDSFLGKVTKVAIKVKITAQKIYPVRDSSHQLGKSMPAVIRE